MIEDTEVARNLSFRKKLYRQIAAGSVIAVLIGMTILAIAPAQTDRFGSITIEDEVVGSTGHSTITFDSSGATDFTLLNTSTFTDESGWLTRVRNPGNEVKSFQDAEGLHIEGMDVSLSIYYYLNIMVEDYDTLEFTSTIESVQGNFSAGISAHFGVWWRDTFQANNATPLTSHSEYLYELDVSMEWLRNRTSNWILQARLEIQVHLDEFASIVIKRATVEATSVEQLYPVVFDFQDTTGDSLYENAATRWLSDIPVCNITSEVHTTSSLLIQWTTNSTIFFPAGNYSVEFAWFILVETNGVPHTDYRLVGIFDLILDEGMGIHTVIKMNVVKLAMDINHSIPFLIDIEGPISSTDPFHNHFLYYLSNYMPCDSAMLYLPADLGELYAFVVLNTPSSPHFSTSIEYDGTHHLKMNARFPYHSVFGVALDTVQLFLLLMMIGLGFAAFVSLKRSLYPLPIASWIRRKRLIPTALMFLSYFLPWFSRNEAAASNQGPITIQWVTYLPSGIETMKAGSGDTIVYMFGSQNVYVDSILDLWDVAGLFPIILVLFWIPMLIMLYQFLYDSPIEMCKSTVLPFALPGTIASLAPIIIDSSLLLFGFIPAILAFLIIVLQALTRTKKWALVEERIGRK